MTLLTDEEARNQICPLIRFCVNEADVVQHRQPAIYVNQPCHGSDCKIGWRWAQDGFAADKRLGFCGAFGKPVVS